MVTSGTQGPEGRTLRGVAGKTGVILTIPPKTLSIPLQVTVSAVRLGQLLDQLSRQGIVGKVLSGIQLSAVKLDGTVIRGRLAAHRVRLALRGRSFRPGVRVFRWNSRLSRYVRVPARRLVVRNGVVVVRLNRPWQLLVLAPES